MSAVDVALDHLCWCRRAGLRPDEVMAALAGRPLPRMSWEGVLYELVRDAEAMAPLPPVAVITAPQPQRYCASGCGRVLVRRPGECRRDFVRRQTCGHGCRAVLLRRHDVTTPRHCICCGALLTPRGGEPPWAFARRKSCGLVCRRQRRQGRSAKDREGGMSDLPDAPRHCAICGAVLVRRDGEPRHNFARRTSCSERCAHALRVQHRGGGDYHEKIAVPRELQPWPAEVNFAAHNVRERRVIARLPGRISAERSLIGNSGEMCAR